MARKPDLIAMKRVFQNQRGFLCHFFAHYYFLWRIVSMRTKGIVLLCSLALLLGACQAGNNKTTTESSSAKTETTDKDKAKTLDKGVWEDKLYARLTKLIKENGNTSSSYDKNKKPYAVFDWDNTTVINDIGEATFTLSLIHI